MLSPVLTVPLCRPEAGHGAGRLRHDCGEGREALPHDDEQEGEPDQGPQEKAEHRPQVLPWQVSSPTLGLGWRREVGRPSAATWLFPALPLPAGALLGGATKALLGGQAGWWGPILGLSNIF